MTRLLSHTTKIRLGQQINRNAARWEERFRLEAEHQFKIDRDRLTGIVRVAPFLGEVGKSIATILTKQTVDWRTVEREWQDYYEIAGDRWRQAFVPLIEGVMTDQGDMLNTAFGFQFDVRNLFAEQWFQDYAFQFAQPIMVTTEETLRQVLTQAMADGWSISRTQDEIENVFTRWIFGASALDDPELFWFLDRVPQWRLEMIARTETLRASNAGNMELYREWDTPFKEWLATGDERTRMAHLQAWASYSEGGSPGPIPMDQPFIVGGEPLMQPGDSSGSPENVIQCRCVSLPFFPDFAGTQEEIAADRALLDAEILRREQEQREQEAAQQGGVM